MNHNAKATFAGGCFWCMVKPFDEWPGIKAIQVGYTGGHQPHPTYEEVCSKQTGHVEAVEIIYDEEKISYEELLEIFLEALTLLIQTDNLEIEERCIIQLFFTMMKCKKLWHKAILIS